MNHTNQYLGAKNGAGTYQRIINSMPPHRIYIEPFRGTASIANRKPPAERTILIDRDPTTFTRYPCAYPAHNIAADAFAIWPDLATNFGPDCCIYADPPYLHATRTSTARYKYELTQEQHIELSKLLQMAASMGAQVILSGYPSPLYAGLYSHWRTDQFTAMTRGGPRTEMLWLSFPPPATPYTAVYAGSDFTDRQRIKRKAARWAANYSRLPPAERLAILSAIIQTCNQ